MVFRITNERLQMDSEILIVWGVLRESIMCCHRFSGLQLDLFIFVVGFYCFFLCLNFGFWTVDLFL